MNILHITPYYRHSCGISKYVFNLLKDFSENKDYKLYLLTGNGDALEKLDSIRVEYHVLELSDSPKKYYNFVKNYYFLKKFCKEKQIDIIHTHHRYPELLAYLVSRKLNIPIITTAHSLVSGSRYLSFRSEKIIAVSKAVEMHLIKNYRINKDRIVQFYNYIEPFPEVSENEKDEFKMKLGIRNNDKIILFVGRISMVKGCDILINAINKLPPKENILLIMVGEVYDNEIYSVIQDHKRIKWYPPQKNIELFYVISDLVVLPSRIDPFPYVMLEAGICKKPFIGAGVNGIKEFIKDNCEGLLFEPENVNELSEKMMLCLENKSICENISNNLYQKVNRLLDKKIYMQNLSAIYQELLIK